MISYLLLLPNSFFSEGKKGLKIFEELEQNDNDLAHALPQEEFWVVLSDNALFQFQDRKKWREWTTDKISLPLSPLPKWTSNEQPTGGSKSKVSCSIWFYIDWSYSQPTTSVQSWHIFQREIRRYWMNVLFPFHGKNPNIYKGRDVQMSKSINL